MNKDTAKQLVKETLENPFDKERFTYFIKNLLNHVEETPQTVYQGNIIKDAFEGYIKKLERIGRYKGDPERKIDVLVVYLKKETSLEHARTMQRNFISWYLNGSRGGELKDAALVAFISPNKEDWRFSLVKMEYKLQETLSGKVKAKEEFTPARRYSFLVGKNENSHTAQSQFVPILEDDVHGPLLQQVENAFSIEKVTKEFFEKYRDLYLWVKEALDNIVENDATVRRDFVEKNISTIGFAKKLLGQIVFLYFLQKKGWFGVKRGEEWGSGSKRFLRELFEKKHGNYKNFFNDILEPLFYEALRLERPKDYYDQFRCRIPFLNGGLFDPINDYDWQDTDIFLLDELFSNKIKDNKTGDIGTGILDVFDRYNFTVKEDEPLEKEVAVDPEMLGKVFENLLEVKDRKSKGTYYTPREIVHYMCQESLANYLVTELDGKVSKEDIETLIKYGETAVEHDSCVVNKGRETKDYSFKLPESIRKNAKLIDEKLASIRVCDPAVGSGAFLVGMMNEIIRSQNALTPYINSSTVIASEAKQSRTPYHFKRHAIQNCLYGVDIDPGAVEIAKLRLWLSLIVDEEEREKIQPLPNLDYKIMQGNSLIEILTSEFLPGTTDQEKNNLVKQLKEAKDELFGITTPSLKDKKRKEIESLIAKIIEHDKKVSIRNLKSQIAGIKNQGKLFTDKKIEDAYRKQILELEQRIQEIENLKLPGPAEHFEWHLNFSEVFHEKEGFDVVIANPPYVRHETIKDLKADLKKEFGVFYCSTADIYTYFYKKGLDVLKPYGNLCFIAPNKFMRAGYGRNTRTLLTAGVTPRTVIDFCDLPIFDATTYPAVLLVEKRRPQEKDQTQAATFTTEEQLGRVEETLSSIGFKMPVASLRPEGWNLERPEVLALMERLRKAGKPLGEYVQGKFYYGIKTGLNEAFVIDAETRKRLIAEDPKSKELIKPWLHGRDIKKWKAEWAGLYVIIIPSSINRQWPWSDEKTEAKARKIFAQTHPTVHEHLSQWEDKLIKRDDQGKFWWELRSCAYYKEFEEPKIIWGNMATSPKFAFDRDDFYISAPANLLPASDTYLVGLLNSSICNWLIAFLAAVRGGNFLEFKPMYVEQVPVYPATEKQKAPVIERVEGILAITKDNDYLDNPAKQAKVREYEKQIDQLVYKLYDLTPAEIEIVERKR